MKRDTDLHEEQQLNQCQCKGTGVERLQVHEPEGL